MVLNRSGGQKFMSTGKDGTIRMFDSESGQQTFHLTVNRFTMIPLLHTSKDENQVKTSQPALQLTCKQFIVGGLDKPACSYSLMRSSRDS